MLASSSPYRKALLARLGVAFEVFTPAIDERQHAGESVIALVSRLAQEKAQAGAARFPVHLIIGSDQVAVRDGAPIGKPQTIARARAQLLAASGRSQTFMTGVCVLDSASANALTEVVECQVKFRQLSTAQIDQYLALEQPLDCAGSIKSEALGVALLEHLETPDPTALQGLPLIALVGLLARHGFDLLDAASASAVRHC